MTYNGYALRCDFSVSEAVVLIIMWLLLTIVTLGLALFVLPYYFLKAPINRTVLLDSAGRSVAHLAVEISFAEILGHAVVWFLLTVVTFGLAYLIYWPAVVKRLLSRVSMREL